MTTTTKVKGDSIINLNTILIAVVLGVMSWVGYTTQQTSVAVAVAAERAAGAAERTAVHDRELVDLRSRINKCEIELVKLARNAP